MHIDTITNVPYTGKTFQNEVSVLVGLTGQFSVVCHDVHGEALDCQDGGLARNVGNTHTIYMLGPGDILIFDAHYCAHYGNELSTPSARMHVTYTRRSNSTTETSAVLIDPQRSFQKYEHAGVYPIVGVAFAQKKKV